MPAYVWRDAYHIDCGEGFVVAVAETEEEARRIALKKLHNYGLKVNAKTLGGPASDVVVAGSAAFMGFEE